jgi:hypothetical protein
MIPLKDWPAIKPSEYQFTDCINIRKSQNGSRIDVMIGYVKKHPEEKSIVLASTYPKGNNFFDQKNFYIKRPEDWKLVCEAVNKLWPEIDGKTTEDEIREAVNKVATEKKLLDLLVLNPTLADSLPKDLDLFKLEENQKNAVVKLIKTGGEISTNTLEKLSKEPLGDLENFNKVLETYRLSTVNSLITHITYNNIYTNPHQQKNHHDTHTHKRKTSTNTYTRNYTNTKYKQKYKTNNQNNNKLFITRQCECR